MSFQSLLKKEKSTSSEMKYWNILLPNIALISDEDWLKRKGESLLPCFSICQFRSKGDPKKRTLKEHIASMPREIFFSQIFDAIDQGKLDSWDQFQLILRRIEERPDLVMYISSDEEFWNSCY